MCHSCVFALLTDVQISAVIGDEFQSNVDCLHALATAAIEASAACKNVLRAVGRPLDSGEERPGRDGDGRTAEGTGRDGDRRMVEGTGRGRERSTAVVTGLRDLSKRTARG